LTAVYEEKVTTVATAAPIAPNGGIRTRFSAKLPSALEVRAIARIRASPR